jgi:curli biogenesis system outer membrane secretion channel CsgG
MKTKRILKPIILFVFIIKGCYLISSVPEVQIKSGFNGEGVAVLNFSTHGNYISPDIGQMAADRFTDALFISNKFNVIDRSKVNDAQKSLEIGSTEFLSDDDVHKLGLKLNSKFLVLGRVQQVSKSDFYNSPKQLYISFRIISVEDSEVVGAGTYSSKYNDDLVKKVESMVYELVNKIRIE